MWPQRVPERLVIRHGTGTGAERHMRRASRAILDVVGPVVTGLGYHFVGAEFGQGENGQTLRIYIDTDAEAGILIEDCAAVSRQVDAVMDVEDPISSAYQLEVSSPGVDRPLFDTAQFNSVLNDDVRVRLLAGVGGRRNYKGKLVGVTESTISIEVDGIDHELMLDDVEQAHLIGRLPSKSPRQ